MAACTGSRQVVAGKWHYSNHKQNHGRVEGGPHGQQGTLLPLGRGFDDVMDRCPGCLICRCNP